MGRTSKTGVLRKGKPSISEIWTWGRGLTKFNVAYDGGEGHLIGESYNRPTKIEGRHSTIEIEMETG